MDTTVTVPASPPSSLRLFGKTVVKARGIAGSPSMFMTANELQVQPAIDN